MSMAADGKVEIIPESDRGPVIANDATTTTSNTNKDLPSIWPTIVNNLPTINMGDIISSCTDENLIQKSDGCLLPEVTIQNKIVVVAPFEDNEKIAIVTLHAIVLATRYGKKSVHREWIIKMLEASVVHFKLNNNALLVLIESLPIYSKCNSFKDVESISSGLVDSLKCGDGGKRNLADVVKAIIAFSIAKGSYDARSRSSIKFIADLFHLPKNDVDIAELSFAALLQSLLKAAQENDESQASRDRKRKYKRAAIIALATLGGAAVLALSAGLAAPLIGAGAVAVLGSGSAVVFTGTTGVAIITSIFGVAGAGLAGVKMNHRVGTLEQFEFGLIGEKKRDLCVTIAISGWLTDEKNTAFASSWKGLYLCEEQYCLCWEGKYLRQFGFAILSFLKKQAVNMAIKEVLKTTILRGVLHAIAWPLTLIKLANVIDNSWSVCLQRSNEAGLQLAKVLLEKHQGHRPTSLIGYSHGANVIYCCLEELAKHKGGVGIVEDVFLFGLPVGVTPSIWESFDSVVAGNIVNCFCRTDWLLKFVFRTASIEVGDVAGLAPIENVKLNRLINVDVSDIISGHMDYGSPIKIRHILLRIGLKTKEFDGCLVDKDSHKLTRPFRNMIDVEAIKQRVHQLSTRKPLSEHTIKSNSDISPQDVTTKKEIDKNENDGTK